MDNWLRLCDPETGQRLKIEILWEDCDLFILNKPSGIQTDPDRNLSGVPFIQELFKVALAEGPPWVKARELSYLKGINSLDLEDTGIYLVAKNPDTHRVFSNALGSEKPWIQFLALAHGVGKEDSFIVNQKLEPERFHPHRMIGSSKGGKKSVTQFKIRQRFRRYTLLECWPLTHRKHQIRVHLKSQGLRVVADSIYGGRPLYLSSLKKHYRLKGESMERPLISGLALHAESISMLHPVTGNPIEVQAPLPKDFRVGLKYLRRYNLPTFDSDAGLSEDAD